VAEAREFDRRIFACLRRKRIRIDRGRISDGTARLVGTDVDIDRLVYPPREGIPFFLDVVRVRYFPLAGAGIAVATTAPPAGTEAGAGAPEGYLSIACSGGWLAGLPVVLAIAPVQFAIAVTFIWVTCIWVERYVGSSGIDLKTSVVSVTVAVIVANGRAVVVPLHERLFGIIVARAERLCELLVHACGRIGVRPPYRPEAALILRHSGLHAHKAGDVRKGQLAFVIEIWVGVEQVGRVYGFCVRHQTVSDLRSGVADHCGFERFVEVLRRLLE